MTCSSDDFGALYVAIKDKAIVACGAVDFSYIVSLGEE